MLRPGGTLAIYFYGRPIFPDPVCDTIYDRMATRICQSLLPFKGAPGELFHRRGAEGLVSFLDNIALPASEWQNVERHKWNCDYPLLFNSPEGSILSFSRSIAEQRARSLMTSWTVNSGPMSGMLTM
jgi:hypothetical protein